MNQKEVYPFDVPHPQKGLVSVIVPCYNQGPYLSECLESIRRQEYADWECILMDDGSSDQSAHVAKAFCEQDSRFHYFHQANAGVVEARNQAISKSTGEFILPLDGDDKIAAPYLAKAVTVLQNQQKVKLVYCKADFFGAVEKKWELPDFSMKSMLQDNIIFCTALFRRSDFIQAGGYNPSMKYGWEDWDFWLSMLEEGGDVMRLDGTYFFYRIRGESRNNSLGDERSRLMLEQLYENHRQLFDAHNVHPLKAWEKRKQQRNRITWTRLVRFLKRKFAPVFS
jgi:glycosyltransferase involved in cell wall biosynthesis